MMEKQGRIKGDSVVIVVSEEVIRRRLEQVLITITTVNKWSLYNIVRSHTKILVAKTMNENINMTAQAINIYHHAGYTMNNDEFIAE